MVSNINVLVLISGALVTFCGFINAEKIQNSSATWKQAHTAHNHKELSSLRNIKNNRKEGIEKVFGCESCMHRETCVVVYVIIMS